MHVARKVGFFGLLSVSPTKIPEISKMFVKTV